MRGLLLSIHHFFFDARRRFFFLKSPISQLIKGLIPEESGTHYFVTIYIYIPLENLRYIVRLKSFNVKYGRWSCAVRAWMHFSRGFLRDKIYECAGKRRRYQRLINGNYPQDTPSNTFGPSQSLMAKRSRRIGRLTVQANTN